MNLSKASWKYLKILVTTSCLMGASCSLNPEAANQARNYQRLPAVDLAIAPLETFDQPQDYTGRTEPRTTVAIRAQTEGRLLNLLVNVGDTIGKGEVIGKLEDGLILADVNRAEAELVTLESEKIRAQLEVNQAQIELQQAQIELQQAAKDAEIYSKLAAEGAISRIQAQNALSKQQLAQKTVLAAEETIKTQEQAVMAIEGRIEAQTAKIAQEKQRLGYTNLTAPLSGIVVQRNSEPGKLIKPGEEVVTIGDFDQVRVEIRVSEYQLDQIEIGQPVKVKLDAFPGQEFSGSVSRIAPIANDIIQIPVDILIDNPNGRIKGGLLARVQFESQQQEPKVIVPTSAIAKQEKDEVIYVITNQEDNQATVLSRPVEVGQRNNKKAVILSGLSPGETYVVRSSKPLVNGDTVGISIVTQPNSKVDN